ncbi:MAG: SDR family oxidoreductase [Alphaproteobacteria bacterium]|nr:SDR family oxidoreductase [Alphaproteobacteria bacterium]
MDLGISGRKAIVNGGSAGMGKGSAKALAREGVDLWLVARGEDRLRAAAHEIAEETGATVTPVVADHSTAEGRARVLAACPEPDILVMTCAPPVQTEDYRDISAEDWHHTMDTTLVSPVEMMKATIDGMVARRFGRIVNIATGAAKHPAEIRLLSGAPRAALVNYTVAVSKRVAKYNVILNNLLPGMFHTATIHDRMTERARQNGTSYDEEVMKFVEAWRIPAGRFGDPDDLGAFCALLCSRHASFMVGQSLVMDGGLINSTF